MADPRKAAQIVEMALQRAKKAVNQSSAFRPTQAGDTVGGFMVREEIPDRSSIGASLENYKTHGLQEVPMSAFETQGKPQYYSKSTKDYTLNLADQINQSKELNPLIVVKDKEGYYVLEGGHRFDALRELNAQSFPALVVEDLSGMAHGGSVHMAEGGDVSAEREQAELDRMRLELGRAQNPNSPVIEATPQSTTQKLLGTVGGYMDRAGKFINKSLEPIAQSNPVKTFLADMLLASPLKGAGTALQDYTKTSRDITEDQPYNRSPFTGSGETLHLDPRVLDIAQFASPVVRGAAKLAGEGAKALTPFAKSTAEMAAEMYGSGKMPFTVAPNAYMADPTVPKPSRVLAPANEQGFYSPVEAAALNLQRKSGNGQAFLNDILKQENVRPDEINAMGLDTFLKDKKNVTAAEVQDYIAQNKLKLGEAVYDNKPKPNFMEFLHQKGIPQEDVYRILEKAENGIFDKQVAPLRDEWLNSENKSTKFGHYQLPGGENYREVVLTLPTKVDQRGFFIDRDGDNFYLRNHDGKTIGEYGSRYEAQEAMQKNTSQDYKSSHWDEPNVLAHLRMSDRVTDGKKTLLVDEVQSDWHQAGREKGYGPTMEKSVEAYYETKDGQRIPIGFGKTKEEAEANIDVGWKTMVDIKYETHERKVKEGVPDAPFKDDWYQLALKRAVKEAIDGGYDRVALPTGKRVADRFDLTAYIDRIDYNKNPDGTYRMSAIKDDQEVFAREGVNEKELPNIVGKEVANKLINNEGKTNNLPVDEFDADDVASQTYQTLSGLDLAVGGEGMKKYYDEIYPNYLKKFGKKYGAGVGKTTVDVEGAPEPLHYMDITPAMREAFKTGIHMKDGGSVNLAEGGIVAGSQGLKYTDDDSVSMESGGYVPMRRGGKVELTNDLAKMRNELQIKKGRK